ncbi:hypothetical protein L6164_037539 [Bauhinia variegata]|uniref:Uncharacterized protein n=1 Tax=Bauhinia variegata TaxID=167791 RepID=A0ACB9KL33_BAUVA|nr:hypothetical protein L6164_037539 [Bauhinia variegata]
MQSQLSARISHPSIFSKRSTLPSLSPCRRRSLSSNSLTVPSQINHRRRLLITACSGPNQNVVETIPEIAIENDGKLEDSVWLQKEKEENVEQVEVEPLEEVKKRKPPPEDQSMLVQMKEILMFSGPATGIWVCAPLMSLIDTAIIGQGSATELAALGPGTVFCDYMSHLFMFLSIATSNMVATSLAKRDKKAVQHHISSLLCFALTLGVAMLVFTRLFGPWALTSFAGAKNLDLIPAANTYVQIRGLAWPAILVGWVAQSASLGMKDSWGPLNALVVAGLVSGLGDVLLCLVLHYGIAGAAWSTMASQVVAAYMMVTSLEKKGYKAFEITLPSPKDFLGIFAVAAPVFLKMLSKVAFYSLITYFAMSMGKYTVAAHQVLMQVYILVALFGEPLSQTAQSFMPELIYGVNQNLPKARRLLKSLLTMGATFGVSLGILSLFVLRFFPGIFTQDKSVVQEIDGVLLPFFVGLVVTVCNHCLEGTLLAGRELKFISMTFTGCFSLGALMLWFVSNKGLGLQGCWWALVVFHMVRFFLSFSRLMSPKSILGWGEESQNLLFA